MSKKQAWMVAVEIAAPESQQRTHFFVVGKEAQLDAVSAVCALPEMQAGNVVVQARRRLAAPEIVALHLIADEIRPLGH
ncbi:hypothetical protein V1281_000265 [Nitrobacteraceae bacterium AZCC 2161]